MSQARMLDQMEMCMRYMYGHFLRDKQTFDMLLTRKERNLARMRYTVRMLVYEHFGCKVSHIAEIERRFCRSFKPNATTISNSLHRFRKNGLREKPGYLHIKELFAESLEYWEELNKPDLKRLLKQLYASPHHVLVVVLALSVHTGHLPLRIFEGLFVEFGSVSKKMLEKELEVAIP